MSGDGKKFGVGVRGGHVTLEMGGTPRDEIVLDPDTATKAADHIIQAVGYLVANKVPEPPNRGIPVGVEVRSWEGKVVIKLKEATQTLRMPRGVARQVAAVIKSKAHMARINIELILRQGPPAHHN